MNYHTACITVVSIHLGSCSVPLILCQVEEIGSKDVVVVEPFLDVVVLT